jgi:hypothetical protein
MLAEVNWLAAIASLIAATIIGTLWYGPLFGKAWMAEIGKTADQLKPAQVPAMVSAFVANFVAAIVLSVALARFGADSVASALGVALLLWIAFTGGQMFMSDRFHLRTVKLSLINAGNTLLTFLAMAVVIRLLS